MAFAEAFYQAVFYKGTNIPFGESLAGQLRRCPLVALQVGKTLLHAAAAFLCIGLAVVGCHIVLYRAVGNYLHIFLKVDGEGIFLAPHVPGEGEGRGYAPGYGGARPFP